MKKIFLIVLPVLLLASCSKDYHNKIVGRQVAQSCAFITKDSAATLDYSGNVEVVYNTVGNPQVCDSVYVVTFTTYQKWQSGNKWDLVIGIGIALGLFAAYGIVTSRGANSKGWLVLPFAAILIGGSFIGGFYYFSTEREIRKADYVKYGGDLETFWQTPAQTY